MDLRSAYEELPFNKKRRRLRKIVRVVKYSAVFLFFFFFVSSLLFLAFNYISIKALAGNLLDGKANIEQAVILAKAKDYENAKQYTNQAQANFTEAKKIVRRYENNLFLEKIGFFRGQLSDTSNLLEAAEVLSRAVSHGLDYASKLIAVSGHTTGTDMNKLTTEEKRAVLKYIYEGVPELNGIKADVALSIMNLEKVQYRGFLRIVKDRGESLENSLVEAHARLEEAVPMAQLLPAIAGYPQKADYLVILQNNDELRPTGGFIGTYGILETQNSDVLRLDTHDVYHMDMPIKDAWKETPPKPLKDYLGVDKWFLRDANWSPDWPTSARKIEDFYWREDALLPEKNRINNFNGKFKGVIAITPKLITDLLVFVGPIKIGNETYDKDNFQRLLQYRVEKGYAQLGVPEWQRKEVIGQIAAELKLRVMNLQGESIVKVLDILSDNLNKRNIVFYFHDPELENLVIEQDWGGEMGKGSGDYLAIVDANLASFKTDAVINRSVNYNIKEGDGLAADLKINYAHSGDFDWRTTTYRTYTRIYVPKGSKLTGNNGFESKVETYEEFGKTVFAGFITVAPRSMKSVELQYLLPSEINRQLNDGSYDLYLRKQAGVNSVDINVNLEFAGKIQSYGPTGFFAYKNKDGRRISWTNEMVADREFTVGFEN